MAYTMEFAEQVAQIQWDMRARLIKDDPEVKRVGSVYAKPWGVIKRDESLSYVITAAVTNAYEILNIALDLGAKPS